MYYVYIAPDPRSGIHRFQHRFAGADEDHKSLHRDWKLAYYEAYASEIDARACERRLKDYGNVKQLLRKRIMRSLQMV